MGGHVKRTDGTATTIDEYIDGVSPVMRSRSRKMRATIRQGAPDATERMAYGIPTFYLNGNLVHFGAFAHHIGFYPTSRGIAAFRTPLARYKGGKGSVQFPHDEPLPLDLVAQIVKFRVADNARKTSRSRRSR